MRMGILACSRISQASHALCPVAGSAKLPDLSPASPRVQRSQAQHRQRSARANLPPMWSAIIAGHTFKAQSDAYVVSAFERRDTKLVRASSVNLKLSKMKKAVRNSIAVTPPPSRSSPRMVFAAVARKQIRVRTAQVSGSSGGEAYNPRQKPCHLPCRRRPLEQLRAPSCRT